MNLLEELQLKVSNYFKTPHIAYEHVQETPEELLEKVIIACRRRADSGCNSVTFHWDYVYTDNKQEWEDQHKIVKEVADNLEKQGLSVTYNKKFYEPYINVYGDLEAYTNHHYIYVNWARDAKDRIKDLDLIINGKC